MLGLAHNDVHGDNICVELRHGMVQVTLIDLGLTGQPGPATRHRVGVNPGMAAAADIFGVATIILDMNRGSSWTPPEVLEWVRMGLGKVASRQPLALLIQAIDGALE